MKTAVAKAKCVEAQKDLLPTVLPLLAVKKQIKSQICAAICLRQHIIRRALKSNDIFAVMGSLKVKYVLSVRLKTANKTQLEFSSH